MFYSPLPEREKVLIEDIAKLLVDSRMTSYVKPFLNVSQMPIGDLLGQLGFLQLGVLTITFPIFGQKGLDFAHLLGLNFNKNAPLILKRIEELEEERKISGVEVKKSLKEKIVSFIHRLRSFYVN